MAMKIRCTECTKKISIDEAFAGGVCRCPYCSALVFIAGGFAATTGRGGRPSAPTSRPVAPGAPPPSPAEMEARAEAQEDIPVADPVKLQGVVTIVLLALLLVMLVGLGFGLRMILSRGGEEHVEVPVPALPTNPLTQPGSPTQPAPGPMVAGDVRIDPPVVYVLDAGGSMSEAYGFAALMTGVSIRSLGNERCNIVVCREAGDRKWSPRSHTGGAAAQAAARKFMEGIIPAGATSIARGFQTALAMKPGTIVLFARKYIDDAEAMGEKAAKQGARVVVISLDSVPDAAEAMADMARASGGQARAFSLGELESFVDKLPPPE